MVDPFPYDPPKQLESDEIASPIGQQLNCYVWVRDGIVRLTLNSAKGYIELDEGGEATIRCATEGESGIRMRVEKTR